ncbi:hypothetical protein diail_12177 [Diaporthe ilicicola]|nr:hypothetical protein diail_12177 [Diaporthe ilicicola]
MPPPCLLPRKGNGKPRSARRVGPSFDRSLRESTSDTPHPTSVPLGGIRRKRPGDEAVGGFASKRHRPSPCITSSSSLVSDRADRNSSGEKSAVVDLTDDTHQTTSSVLEQPLKSTLSLPLGSPSSKAQGIPRHSRPLSASTPSCGAKKKSEVIDLTFDDDSDDGPTLPSTPVPNKTAGSEANEEVIDLTTDETLESPSVHVASTCQRPESILQYGSGQTPSVNDDHSAATKGRGPGDSQASHEGLRSILAIPPIRPPRSADSAQTKSAIDVARAQASTPRNLTTILQPPQITGSILRGFNEKLAAPAEPPSAPKPRTADSSQTRQTSTTFQLQPKLGLALDRRTTTGASPRVEDVGRSSNSQFRETAEDRESSQARQSFRLAPLAQVPSLLQTQPRTGVDIDSDEPTRATPSTRIEEARGPHANVLPTLCTGGNAPQRAQARHGAAVANSVSVSPNGSSKSISLELKYSSGSSSNSALDVLSLHTAKLPLANGLPSLAHMRQVEKDQLRRGCVVMPRVEVQDRDHGPREIDSEPKNGDRERAVHGGDDINGANASFDAVDRGANPEKDNARTRVDLFKRQQMCLRRSRIDVVARNNPLSSIVPVHGRDSNVKDLAQDRHRSDSGQEAGDIETDFVGGGKGSAELSQDEPSVSRPLLGGASKLREPSGSIVRVQAQKQNELVADGLAEGSEGRDECSSSSSSSGPDLGGDRAQSQQEQEHQRPRQSRRQRQLIVTLRAPSHELHRVSLRPVQRPDRPMGECFLIKLPVELQQKIYQHLLIADGPIQVINGWSKLYQRQRSNLDPAILSTCKTIFENASAVLYGQNVFQYKLRDTARLEVNFRRGEQTIDIAKYISYFRKLELKIERSRTELAYGTALARAIRLLITHCADLTRLVLDISPSVEGDTLSTVGYFYRQGEVIEALKALSTKSLQLRVFTPKTRSAAPKRFVCTIDRGSEASTLPLAESKSATVHVDNLSEAISLACESPSEALDREWFKELESTPERGNEHIPRTREREDDDQSSDDSEELDDTDEDNSSDFEG